MTKTVLHSPVMTKARKFRGQAYPSQPTEHNAEIVPGESIRIWGDYCAKSYEQNFKIGDEAEYNSYNLRYTGEIVGIGAKTVTIKHYPGSDEVTQLDLETFCWRNYAFDSEAIAAQNNETMQYI
jgi:hypothetical protein